MYPESILCTVILWLDKILFVDSFTWHISHSKTCIFCLCRRSSLSHKNGLLHSGSSHLNFALSGMCVNMCWSRLGRLEYLFKQILHLNALRLSCFRRCCFSAASKPNILPHTSHSCCLFMWKVCMCLFKLYLLIRDFLQTLHLCFACCLDRFNTFDWSIWILCLQNKSKS